MTRRKAFSHRAAASDIAIQTDKGTREVVVKSISPGSLPTAPELRASPDKTLQSLLREGYSNEEVFDLVVPKRTLARRQSKKELLTVEETDKALRLVRIAELAKKVFGDEQKAHRWLRKPKRSLKGEKPLTFLASESGARIVEEMLWRVDSGMLA
jgi:putative toxin-antitoxin system antitoxin component (TIGR02293 family)